MPRTSSSSLLAPWMSAAFCEHWTAQRRQWTELLGSDRPPLYRSRDLFEATEMVQRIGQRDHGAVVGCRFGNLALELRDQADDVRHRLQEIFDAQIDMVEQVVAEARERGDVAATVDTRETARSIVAQLEGQVLFAKLLGRPNG